MQGMIQLTVDILSVRVGQARGTVSVTSEPLAFTVVGHAVGTSLDIGVQVGAVMYSVAGLNRLGQRVRKRRLLQHSAIVIVLGAFSLEFLRALTKQTPVLLEDAEVGCVAGFVVSYQTEVQSEQVS